MFSLGRRCKRGGKNKLASVFRVAFRTNSELEAVDDGFKWRKYGKKSVKSSPNPRNYCKCSSGGCHVKKRAERDKDDSSYVITTYEGVHNHESPESCQIAITKHIRPEKILAADQVLLIWSPCPPKLLHVSLADPTSQKKAKLLSLLSRSRSPSPPSPPGSLSLPADPFLLRPRQFLGQVLDLVEELAFLIRPSVSLARAAASDLLGRNLGDGAGDLSLRAFGRARLGTRGGKGLTVVAAKLRKEKKHEYLWPEDPDPNMKDGVLSHLSPFEPLNEKPKPVTLEFDKPRASSCKLNIWQPWPRTDKDASAVAARARLATLSHGCSSLNLGSLAMGEAAVRLNYPDKISRNH